VLFVDQVSVNILFLKLFSSSKVFFQILNVSKVLFYCHHPDKLLVKEGGGFLKKLYRLPFDYLEEKTTSMADSILVNSKYTQDVFKSEFKSIKMETKILYPAINLKNYDLVPKEKPTVDLSNKIAITSVNRFEKKKNIPLAMKAFALLKDRYKNFEKLVLVIGGGFDPRVKENQEVLEELKTLIEELKLNKEQIIFLPSFSSADRYVLFHESTVITYTPENEHFGIVPIEAQYGGRFVVACNSGGPLETITHGETGYLVEPTPESFADGILKVLQMKNSDYNLISKKARQNVIEKFSLESFSEQLNKIIVEL
jgi:alpha-1,3/alpha-1,6-mannosyltransferase